VGAGAGNGSSPAPEWGVVAAAAPFAGEDEDHEAPWRRVPAVGTRVVTALPPLAPMRNEPVAIVHARPRDAAGELPPLRTIPGSIFVGFGAAPPRTRPSEVAIVSLIPNEPIDGSLPRDLLPPAVGGAVPGGAPVPEPGALAASLALLATAALRRRRSVQ
jgi:hypothetical protein